MATLDVQIVDEDPLSDQSASTWFEPVPKGYRRLRAAVALAIAAMLSGWLAWVQISNGIFGQVESIWLGLVIAVGAWRSRYWTKLEEVRRFATVAVPLTKWDRLRKASVFLLLGFGGIGVIWPMQYHFGQLGEYWLNGLPFLLLGLIGVFIFFYFRTEKRLTPQAVMAKAQLAAHAVKAAQTAPWTTPKIDAAFKRLETLIEIPLVRYPLAALVLWFAYYVSQEWTDRRSWLAIVAAVCVSLWLARELFGWVLGMAIVGGIAWAIFAGVAALPVSAAIVIGAVIIASAMKK